MSNDTWYIILVTVLLALLSGVGVMIRYLFIGAMRWARTEQQLEELVKDVKQLVQDKDHVHEQFDRRMRWLEENLWKGRH